MTKIRLENEAEKKREEEKTAAKRQKGRKTNYNKDKKTDKRKDT